MDLDPVVVAGAGVPSAGVEDCCVAGWTAAGAGVGCAVDLEGRSEVDSSLEDWYTAPEENWMPP